MWKKHGTAGQPKDDKIRRRMRNACWITKATHTHTHTHTKYVNLIAFPRQQWLRELTSMLRYIYTACFAFSYSSAVSTIKFS